MKITLTTDEVNNIKTILLANNIMDELRKQSEEGLESTVEITVGDTPIHTFADFAAFEAWMGIE